MRLVRKFKSIENNQTWTQNVAQMFSVHSQQNFLHILVLLPKIRSASCRLHHHSRRRFLKFSVLLMSVKGFY